MFLFPPEIKFENEKGTDEPHAKESPKDGSVVFSPSGLRCHVYDLTTHLFGKYCILRKRDFRLKKVKKDYRPPNDGSKGAKELLQSIIASQLFDGDHHCSLTSQNTNCNRKLPTSNIMQEEARRTSMIALRAI